MLEGESFDIKKEAAWAISNATSGGDHNQVAYLVQCNCIPPLCALLECGDTKIVTVVLEALENILKVGQSAAEMAGSMDDNPFRDIIEECGGIDKIEALQNFDKQEIVEKAVELICKARARFCCSDWTEGVCAASEHSGAFYRRIQNRQKVFSRARVAARARSTSARTTRSRATTRCSTRRCRATSSGSGPTCPVAGLTSDCGVGRPPCALPRGACEAD